LFYWWVYLNTSTSRCEQTSSLVQKLSCSLFQLSFVKVYYADLQNFSSSPFQLLSWWLLIDLTFLFITLCTAWIDMFFKLPIFTTLWHCLNWHVIYASHFYKTLKVIARVISMFFCPNLTLPKCHGTVNAWYCRRKCISTLQRIFIVRNCSEWLSPDFKQLVYAACTSIFLYFMPCHAHSNILLNTLMHSCLYNVCAFSHCFNDGFNVCFQ